MEPRNNDLSALEATIAREILTQHRLDSQFDEGELSFQEYREASINQGNGWSECAVCDWSGSTDDAERVGKNRSQRVRFYCPLCGSDTKRKNNTSN